MAGEGWTLRDAPRQSISARYCDSALMRTAENALRRRRQECEQAARLVAELAELAESLQRSLNLRA